MITGKSIRVVLPGKPKFNGPLINDATITITITITITLTLTDPTAPPDKSFYRIEVIFP